MAASLNQIEECSVPIVALQFKTKKTLSNLLNPPKVLPVDNGLQRDWRGLASLLGLKFDCTSALAHDNDPTTKILQIWYESQKCHATIDLLQSYLEQIDRYDVIDDTVALIDQDIKTYKENRCNAAEPIAKEMVIEDEFDAYVLFADEDISYAVELLEVLEKDYNLKLFAKERDLVGGLPFEHKAIINLISERCKHLILIITPEFFKSPANEFFYSYAQAMAIKENKHKIIPCIYKNCELPIDLVYYAKIHYSGTPMYNFWDKLSTTIKQTDSKQTVTRSVSEQNSTTVVMQKQSKKQSVKFCSTGDLNKADIKDPSLKTNIAPNLSSVDLYTLEKPKKKSNSFKRLKKFFHLQTKPKIAAVS